MKYPHATFIDGRCPDCGSEATLMGVPVGDCHVPMAARIATLEASPFARLETWSSGHRARSVRVERDNGYGATCWTVQLRHEHGATVACEAQFMTYGADKGGQPAYLAKCRELGTVFAAPPEDADWAGLSATIELALSAFDAGVWGPRAGHHPDAEVDTVPVGADADRALLAPLEERIAELEALNVSIAKAQAAGYEHGGKDERAAVVRWLRDGADDPGRGSAAFDASVGRIYRHLGTAIDFGAHCK